MKLYSYIVARDFGFAPNPFHGFCTLATCKPRIRSGAGVGDWIIGTGAKKKYKFAGRLIYAMQVSEVLDFDRYWTDPRFLRKRPSLGGSLKVIYGDNIYHREDGRWVQADSHHSLENGHPNNANIAVDTSVNRLLVGTKFVYWGRAAPTIPKQFRSFRKTGEDICCRARNHRVFEDELATSFVDWLEQQGKWGVQGEPLEFEKHKRAANAVAKSVPTRAARRTRQQTARRSTR
ncbi:hypothetical protein ACN6A1_26700 [Myxococcus virescens]|uniref:Nmad2 family putative nucleotide modification protein n=1 Tax=Myxococcus virescens TaxID=83456 RepID=UPI003DA214E7